MERYRIDKRNLISSIYLAERERKKLGKSTRVRIILSNNADFLVASSLGNHLQREHIPYYLDYNGTGNSIDYKIDLGQLEIYGL